VTGPWHYAEAERLADTYKEAISAAEAMSQDTPMQADERFVAISNARSLLDKAQVHATLAQVAATVEPRIWDESDACLANAWAEVLS